MSELITMISPGEILNEEFLKPAGISQTRLAKDLTVCEREINEVVTGKRAISAEMALRLGRYFQMAPEFWMNLQKAYDLEAAQNQIGKRLEKEVKIFSAR